MCDLIQYTEPELTFEEKVDVQKAFNVTFFVLGSFTLFSLLLIPLPANASQVFHLLANKHAKESCFEDYSSKINKKVGRKLGSAVKNAVKSYQAEININTPAIDLIDVFYTLKSSVKPIQAIEVVPLNVNKERLLLLKGGFIGYLIQKISTKISETTKSSIDGLFGSESTKKSKNSILNDILNFLSANPVVIIAIGFWAYLNNKSTKKAVREVLYATLPAPVANSIIGKKESYLGNVFKNIDVTSILFNAIDVKKPFLYLILGSGGLYLIKGTLHKWLFREINSNQAWKEITEAFIKNQKHIFDTATNSFKDSMNFMRKRNESYEKERAQKENEAFQESKKNNETCQEEKKATLKDLDELRERVQECTNTYNLLHSKTVRYTEQSTEVEAQREVMYLYKKNLRTNDPKMITVTHGEIIDEGIEWKLKYEDIYKRKLAENIIKLQADIIPKTFDEKKT